MSQPAPKPGREAVLPHLIRLLQERAAKGEATYGRPLETFNGRDATHDALEEFADAAMYLMQENRQLRAQLAEARTEGLPVDGPDVAPGVAGLTKAERIKRGEERIRQAQHHLRQVCSDDDDDAEQLDHAFRELRTALFWMTGKIEQ